jgi:hypothetical protein
LIGLANPKPNAVGYIEKPSTPGQAARVTVVRENDTIAAPPPN